MKTIGRAFLVLLVVFATGGQRADDLVLDAFVSPSTRSVYVTVLNDQGKAVPSLTPADFVVTEGGKACEIRSVAPATEKMRLALMIGLPLAGRAEVRQGLADLVPRIYPSAEVALFLVAQRAEKLVDFSSDPYVLIEGISRLPFGGTLAGAMVPDAVLDVARQLEMAQPSRPVIVLLTTEQGMVPGDAYDALNQLARSKAQFWAVSAETTSLSVMGVEPQAFTVGRPGWVSIADGPKQSGGRLIEVAVAGIPNALQRVADDLGSQYLVTYALPEGFKTSDRITVTVKKPGLTLLAPNRVPK